MSVVLYLPLLLIITAPIVWLVARTRTPHTGPEYAAVSVLHRRSAQWLGVGLGLAVLALLAVLLLGTTGLGRGAALAPAVAGTLLVLVICVGELRTPRQSAPTRTALPRVRRVRDYVTAGPSTTAALSVVALGTTLVVGTLLGSPDDLGRAGRALTTVCGDVTSSRGPWPGSYYALPIAAATLVSLVAAAVTCRTIALRPSQGGDTVAVDDALRRWSMRSVLLAVALVGWVTLVPLLLLMASALSMSDCTTSGLHTAGIVAGVGALVSAVAAVGTFVALCLGPALRSGGQTPPPSSGDHAAVGVPQ